jgi:hypothetical protein
VPVASLATDTLAPGMAPPAVSTTVPEIEELPEAPCAKRDEGADASNTVASRSPIKRSFI